MQRFNNILAVYGDSVGADDALGHAVSLARANSAALTIIDVGPERYMSSIELAERIKRLNRLKYAIKSEGDEDIDAVAISGTPFLEIIRQVLLANHDLVIASAVPNASFKSYFFGSTATHLLRKCPCPVWIVKPGTSNHYKKILACVDPKSSAEKKNELDRKILDLSTSLAARDDAKLHIVHAWDVEGKDREMLTSDVPDLKRAQILVEHERKHRARVERLLDKYPIEIPKERFHSPRAREPQWAILELVEKLNVDLIVMGTVCRTGISGFFIGNAAETILSLVKCGVFTVKPEGFVSPVTLDTKVTRAA